MFEERGAESEARRFTQRYKSAILQEARMANEHLAGRAFEGAVWQDQRQSSASQQAAPQASPQEGCTDGPQHGAGSATESWLMQAQFRQVSRAPGSLPAPGDAEARRWDDWSVPNMEGSVGTSSVGPSPPPSQVAFGESSRSSRVEQASTR